MRNFNAMRVIAVVLAVVAIAIGSVGVYYCNTPITRISTGLTSVFVAFVILALVIRSRTHDVK